MFLPIMMGAGALLQSRANERRRDQQERFNKGQAETTRYSPWTGMQGQLDQSYVPGTLESLAGGAIQGASMAQGLQGMMGGMGGAPTPQPTAGQFMDQMQMAQPQQQIGMNMQPGLYGSSWNNMA
jgi:hypothetical protein